jgi:hypothetical protein
VENLLKENVPIKQKMVIALRLWNLNLTGRVTTGIMKLHVQ